MLDLGVWMAMQSVVEKEHFGQVKNPDALWWTMERAWEMLVPKKLNNIYERWKLILELIIEDEGGNHLIESKRGKLYSNIPEEAETLEDVEAMVAGDDDYEQSEDEAEQKEINEADSFLSRVR